MRGEAGRDRCGAGGHTCVRDADAAALRAQKTRSKCRRCFTVLHHHTSPSRLFSLTHNSKYKTGRDKPELFRLIRNCIPIYRLKKMFWGLL